MNTTKALLVLAVVAGAFTLASCAPKAPSTPSTWPAAGCYDSPTPGTPDLRFSGSPGVVDNLTASILEIIPAVTISSNGTCSGIPLGAPYALTVVRASSEGSALTTCIALGLGAGVGQMNLEYPAFPADAWICNPTDAA
jgi:hypothetical protein